MTEIIKNKLTCNIVYWVGKQKLCARE